MTWLDAFPLTPAVRSAPPGEVLLARHSTPSEALYLRGGRAVAGLLVRGDLRHRLLVFEAPCWLDAPAVLLRQPAACDWVADSAVELWAFPAAGLRQWQATLPQAVQGLLQDMAQAQQRQTAAALALMAQDAEARCAQWLLQHARQAGDGLVGIELQQRKRTIAAQLGMAPETFSRVLRHLRERGLIRQDGAMLQLTDPAGLRQLATA